MPSIVGVPYPTRGHVLLEVDFGDVSGATHVCVEAVTGVGTDDEVRRPLHAYVSYNANGCIALSCGQAILWDTEISCGVPTMYCATAMNAAGEVITEPADAIVTDTFTRVVANGWGTADSGQAWTTTGGAAADYSVTGTRGQMAVTSTGVDRTASMAITNPNVEAMVTMIPTVVAVGGSFEQSMRLRDDGTGNNYYRVLVEYDTGGNIDVFLQRQLGGVGTNLATAANLLPYAAASQFNVRFSAWGSQLRVKVWDSTTPEPAAFTLTATDATVTGPGNLMLASRRNGGNANGTINMQFDNLIVSDVCAEPVPVEVCTEAFTNACDGCFRLGDPVRPCNDVRICLCAGPATCEGTPGLFFAGMSADTYASNSGNLLPVNAKYPIVTSRTRRGASGQFDIVATSFTQRDALLDLLDPGGPLLWRGPANFGTGDRYISVGDVPVAPQIADLTIQPRLMPLPFLETKAPVGPTLGVCGSRVKDLCDVYDTWDELIAAGLTYADLLRGDASTPGSGLATWADINAQNASWNALQAAETDWTDVLDGD